VFTAESRGEQQEKRLPQSTQRKAEVESMGRVELGLILPELALAGARRDSYVEDVHRLLNTVKGHFASAWMIDHLQQDLLEGWTALTYLAALHPELMWGHTVLSQSFRNPALVAKMAATLQFLSGGRFILGMGAGGDAEEHRAYGYEFAAAGVRVAQLDEALQIIKALWTQPRVTFAGAHYQVEDAWCAPQPIPVPTIMVGAFRPKMLRLTARHADWWNVSSTNIVVYRAYVQEFARACEEVGRDPATVRRTWGGGCVCAPTATAVKVLAADRRDKLGEGYGYDPGEDLIGTPAQLIERMQEFVELGVDYFMLDCGGFPQLTTVERLIDEVLPALNG
jgi:alkanesulfonate monooxygenase SsuD/methylene tetrahydromethanopterin reductase-like flavin-dependent oxidoreductase (luciferase family)